MFGITMQRALLVLSVVSSAVGYGRTEKSAREEADEFCRPFPSVLLEETKTSRLRDGSVVHDNTTYPVGSYRLFGNETRGCPCAVRACLRKCCRRNEILGGSVRLNCTDLEDAGLAMDLLLEESRLSPEIRRGRPVRARELFFLLEGGMSCPEKTGRFVLEPDEYPEDAFVLQQNGTLRTGLTDYSAASYCLDWRGSFEKIAVLVCPPSEHLGQTTDEQGTIKVGIIISVPFFIATFLVYAIIPELRNLYGKTLMCYVGCLVVAYCLLVAAKLGYFDLAVCSAIAFAIHFSFLASFFWLNVMCFDIWWTFGGFRALQGSVKQRERKKFIVYSIYAWGSASILTGVCALMDSIPDVPKYFKPQFGVHSCWFPTDAAKALYFYGPMGVTVVCNICLFVSTAVKIVRHKKDTARHLKGTDSRRHDDNKQWFNLYLKLFIVMGINWSMEIVSWLCDDSSTIFTYIWYVTDLTNTLQGVIIFLIFVWKDKIKRLLLKRFGCRRSDVLSRNSTRSVYHSSASRTCTTAVPLQEKPIRLPTTVESAVETIAEARPVAVRSPSDDDCA